MAFKLNNGQIVLNQVPQQEGKKLPALKGKLKLFGIAIPVVLWTKTTNDDKKWWSGHVGEEAPEYESSPQQSSSGNNTPPQDDDLPF